MVVDASHSLGGRILELRGALHLEQDAFGEVLGVTASLVSKWENNHRRPRPWMLALLTQIAAQERPERTGYYSAVRLALYKSGPIEALREAIAPAK